MYNIVKASIDDIKRKNDMAFFDWNHDGKKNYVDNAIEMMVIEDIESEANRNNKAMSYENSTPTWGVGYSGEKAYSKKNRTITEDDEKLFVILKKVGLFWVFIIATLIFVINLISLLFGGYVSVIGFLICAVVLVLTIRIAKKRNN